MAESNSLGPSQGRRLLRRSVAIGAWGVLAIVAVVFVLLRYGDDWWPGTLLMFSPRWPWVLLAMAATLASALIRRRSLLPALLSLFVSLGPVTGLCVPWRPQFQERSAGVGLRILTCNMHWTRTDPARLDELIREVNPDVVALQEWRSAPPTGVLSENGWFIEDNSGLFLASRHPIARAQRIGDDSMGPRGSATRYELDTPAGRISMFSLHLASPRAVLGQIASERTVADEGLESNSELRWRQSIFIAGDAHRAKGSVVIVGDFNTPPESVLFDTVWKGYDDAFGEAGFGWGYTFINRLTRVRIDHILVGPSGRASRCWLGPNVGSPHRPLIADIVWPSADSSGAAESKP